MSVPDSTLVDRTASPGAENHVVTKICLGLRKASIHTGGPRDFLLSGSRPA